jgi:hypothetical protein
MPSWLFVGTIVPERTPFIKLQLNWSAEVPSFKLKYDISVAIAENQISATVTITSGDTEFHTLRNLTEQSIRSIVDVVGYYKAVKFDVEMISAASLDTPSKCVFGPAIPALAARRPSDRELSIDFLMAVAGDIPSQMVLADV